MTEPAGPHDPRPLISVIVPAFNEARNVARTHAAISELFEGLAGQYRCEMIFTDNHSTDSTFAELKEIAAADRRVRVYRFARNFGFQRSVLTGYRLSRGDAAVQIDCDLQDPPAVIARFLEKWREGHDAIVGVRIKREREKWAMIQLRRVFYRLLARISNDDLPVDAGDFRLIDRSIIERLRRIDDAQPYLRGLVSSLSRRQVGVPYERSARLYDESKFPISKLIGLAMDGILAHSIVPLRIAVYVGLLVAATAALVSLFYIVGALFFGQQWPSGFATTTVLILFGISLNALFLGVIGEYVGRIYRQVRARPTVVIEEVLNDDLDRAATSIADGPTLAAARYSREAA